MELQSYLCDAVDRVALFEDLVDVNTTRRNISDNKPLNSGFMSSILCCSFRPCAYNYVPLFGSAKHESGCKYYLHPLCFSLEK